MSLPLHNRRIALTRAAEQSAGLAVRLSELGALPIICPAVGFALPDDYVSLDQALQRISEYDWLFFTSANAVRFTLERLRQLQIDSTQLEQLDLAVVGPGTARWLAAYGLKARLIAEEYSAEGLLDAIEGIEQAQILLPASDIARTDLAEGLRLRGAYVEQVVAYRTVEGDGCALLAPMMRLGSLDATIFYSPSAVRYLLKGLDRVVGLPEAIPLTNLGAIICIGHTTAAAVQQAGLPVAAIAAEATDDAVITALLQHQNQLGENA